MIRYVLLLLFIGLAWGQNCTADDGTEGIELWGECYSIENTDSLNLSNSGLTGEILPEIGNLTNLTHLRLNGNQLTGEIPSEIWNLLNLTRLSLGGNYFTGEISSEIGNLTYLNYLHLGHNEFIGEIPPEIGNLTNLYFLYLNNNQLTGVIPDEICNQGDSSLYLGNNQLCPPYPSCIENYVGEQDTTNCEQVSIIDETLPITYNIHNAYPNPFNPVTTLRYDLPKDAMVNITIYNMIGRQIKSLVNGSKTAGYRTIQWNATNDKGAPVSAGLYLYTIQAGQYRQTKKMLLLK